MLKNFYSVLSQLSKAAVDCFFGATTISCYSITAIVYSCALFGARSVVIIVAVGSDMCEIKHTVKVSFRDGTEKPNMGEIVNFVKALDTDPRQIEAVYRIAEEKAVFMKYKSEESMLHTLTFNSEDLTFHYGNGKETVVRISHAGEFIQYVRIYDLPPEIPDQEIASVLGKYGKVKRTIREKFPAELCFDAYTGVRGVYIDVKKEIPTSLHFLNRKGNIYYPGNKDKCFLCKTNGHRMNACPKRKTRKEPAKQQQNEGMQQGTQTSSSSTYANIVAEVSSLEKTDHTETKNDEEVMNEGDDEDLWEDNVEESNGEKITEKSNGQQASETETQKTEAQFRFTDDPIYKKAKELWKIQQDREAAEQRKERKKLQARVKTSLKTGIVSPPRKKHS